MNPDRDYGRIWRDATPRVLAALARRGASLPDAQDALQETLIAAASQWPADGTPVDAVGWLITVAGRRLTDARRSDSSRTARERTVYRREPGATVVPAHDDSLALLLLCCHPALPRASQVALTLRAVGGLATAQIARAFLVPEATMAQRLSRARARLREVDEPFAGVVADELPDRVAAVREVLHLVFTEGHTSTAGAGLTDVSLTAEAIRLTRQLRAALTDDTETAGLLALMLLTDARRAARTSTDGALVPLTEQDRTRWDRALIDEGVALVEQALPRGRVGPFQLQAAIAAVHAEAADAESTDWAQIVALYDMLLTLDPGPVVELNRAVAVAMVDGPAAGLAIVDRLDADRGLTRQHRVHAVRAHLLERAGRRQEAAEVYALAAGLATSAPEQRLLIERAARCARDAVEHGETDTRSL